MGTSRFYFCKAIEVDYQMKVPLRATSGAGSSYMSVAVRAAMCKWHLGNLSLEVVLGLK